MSRPLPRDAGVSARMRRQRERDTQAEMAVRRALFAQGRRYRLHYKIPGTRREIDIAFPGQRVAVFVDGCFWHMCPEHASFPSRNAAWWRAKLEVNVSRDHDTDERLAEAGWTTVRVWEHMSVEEAVGLVEEALLRSGAPAGKVRDRGSDGAGRT